MILGYQLMVYFLYQYYKSRDRNLEFNRILLAYGLFFGFENTSFVFRIVETYYLQNSAFEPFLVVLSLTLIVISLILFLLSVSTKAFSIVINLKFSKTFGVVLIAPIFFYLVYSYGSVEFIFSLLFILAGFGYILFFQLRLIQKAKGAIKNRLRLIFCGELIFVVAIFMGRETSMLLFLRPYSLYLLLISAPLSLIGLMIIFLGVFKFPAFLEFDWQNDLIKLYIINKTGLIELFSFDFVESERMRSTDESEIAMSREKDSAFPKAVIGISDVFSTITSTANINLKRIRQENLFILLEYSDSFGLDLVFTLVTKRDSNSAVYFLNALKNQFLSVYKNILINFSAYKENIKEIFSSFDADLKNLLK